MSESDQPLEAEEPTEPATPEETRAIPDFWENKARKHQKENESLRRRLRRAEMELQYGHDVVELVPDSLPVKEAQDLAAQLAKRLAPSTPAPTEESVPEEPAGPTEQEIRLAALNTSDTGPGEPAVISYEEWKGLLQTNPGQAMALRNQVQFETGVPNPLRGES